MVFQCTGPDRFKSTIHLSSLVVTDINIINITGDNRKYLLQILFKTVASTSLS